MAVPLSQAMVPLLVRATRSCLSCDSLDAHQRFLNQVPHTRQVEASLKLAAKAPSAPAASITMAAP
jgi:hypothetical protein